MREAVVGIIGAGKLGTVLAQLALRAGYEVYASASGSPEKIRLTVDVLAPGALAVSAQEAAERANIVILALPLSKFRELPREQLAGKMVIDATNYWWEVDGPRSNILPDEQSSSEAVQEFLPDSRVVKAFSHMSYHDLHNETRPKGRPGRKAIAVASDDEQAATLVSELVENFGFDAMRIGPLSNGRRLEPGTPAFGANVDADNLKQLVDAE